VDHAGPVHHGPATIAALGSSPELGLRPLRCPRAPTEGGGEEGRVGEPNGGVATAREAVEASARKGDGEGMVRAKRGSVGGVGGFNCRLEGASMAGLRAPISGIEEGGE
jgi:hypothetical protein